jgi:hypothetical protein
MRRPSLLIIVYVVVGVIVAASYNYFDNLKTAGRVLTLIAAILCGRCCRSASMSASTSRDVACGEPNASATSCHPA